jgi:GH25 family lysozyme M1 (1,4-beta-N-acetylmuramidase)
MGDGLRLYESDSPSPRAVVCPDGDTLPGIDISKWQADVDWNAVANDGIVFAFVRVSDGLNTPDNYFDQNWAEARAAGIYTGVYQFFRPAQDPIAQADLLLDRMGPLGPDDLPPVIDVEDTGGLSGAQITDAIHTWVDRVEGQLGVQPIIYTGRYFWEDNVGSSDFSGYPLWIAHYTQGCPNIPAQWSDWVFHQYTDSGSVAGVSGNCDRNTFNGDLATLLEFVGGGEATCGDGDCSVGEDADNCPEDCPPCGTIGPDGGTIDNGDECLELLGPAQYWREESAGHGGSLVWTMTTDLAQPSNYAIWHLHFEEPGEYRLEAYVLPEYGTSQQATYEIAYGDSVEEVVIDQSAASGWTDLLDLTFEEGGSQWVRLDDNTGEPNADEAQLVVDALRVTRLDGDGSDTSDGSDGSDDSGDGGTDGGGDDGGGDDSGDDGGADDGGGEGDTSDDGGGDGALPPYSRDDDGDGCGCRASRGSPWTAWLVLVIVWGRRPRLPAG